ncbi:MAG: uroporphyrinogen decarboxylase [Legionellales bacterium RIFCSPHIGHO2_12_FULL_42_9]|nr:MAG: uroporphyrinogen decarboxylase [Legionellales bacterium RIFCSPHIGHO2_12_FULL_42_9]
MAALVQDSLLIRALLRKSVERTPVWIMRQAGRYLPEYRKIREKAGNFLNLCKNPELACEVALQPLRRYPLDAAILFSDILTIPDAMGLGLYFSEGEGPRFHDPIRQEEDVHHLPTAGLMDELAYVFDAVRLIRHAMPSNLPLIGFAGSPWTLACYMVEGGGNREFKKILSLVYSEPLVAHQLLTKLALVVADYLIEQIKAGANVLMIFDTWGGILTKSNYLNFSLDYVKRMITVVKAKYPHVPIIFFTKGGGQWLVEMAQSGCDALSLDWTIDLAAARRQVGEKVALQGNLDPAVLLVNHEVIHAEVGKVLASFGEGHGHVFNLGHGITPDVPPEHVEDMIDAVRELSPAYH